MISVIVPAYNLEKTLPTCLESLLAQDYGDIEIIVVDDASTDSTVLVAESILEESGVKYKIVRHTQNMGVATARNSGMEHAQGAYLAFMDGDDAADEDFLSILHKAISQKEAALAFCGFRVRDKMKGVETLRPIALTPSKLYSGEEVAAFRLMNKIKPGIWCFLFRREFLISKNLRFADGCIAGEDTEFVVKALARCEKVSFAPYCPYVYIIHADMGTIKASNTTDKKLRRYISNTEAHFRLADYLFEYSKSKKLLGMVKNMLLPEAYIRLLTIYAKSGKNERFDEMLASPMVRRFLLRSYKIFPRKPSIFMKALVLLFFPQLYFSVRSSENS